MKNPAFVFFGTSSFSVAILEELTAAGLSPALIVTAPDAPQGRKLIVTPSPVKVWGEEAGIPVLTPPSLKAEGELAALYNSEWDLFVVASYGKLLPGALLSVPKYGTLNVHPSLLPRFRGASPVRSAILADERTTGVSIMLLDEEMDHGPVVAQARIEIEEEDWPMRAPILEELLAHAGGELLAETIPAWISGALTPEEQEHTAATYSEKLTKADGELDLSGDPYQNLLKIRAYEGWPGTYFFDNGTRVKIVDVELAEDGTLRILRVVPEGKKEMDYEAFKKN